VNFYLPGYVKNRPQRQVQRAGKVVKVKFSDTNDQVIDDHVRVRPDVIVTLGKLAAGGIPMESARTRARPWGFCAARRRSRT